MQRTTATDVRWLLAARCRSSRSPHAQLRSHASVRLHARSAAEAARSRGEHGREHQRAGGRKHGPSSLPLFRPRSQSRPPPNVYGTPENWNSGEPWCDPLCWRRHGPWLGAEPCRGSLGLAPSANGPAAPASSVVTRAASGARRATDAWSCRNTGRRSTVLGPDALWWTLKG